MAAVAAVQQAHKSSRRTTVHAANDSSAGAHCRVGEREEKLSGRRVCLPGTSLSVPLQRGARRERACTCGRTGGVAASVAASSASI